MARASTVLCSPSLAISPTSVSNFIAVPMVSVVIASTVEAVSSKEEPSTDVNHDARNLVDSAIKYSRTRWVASSVLENPAIPSIINALSPAKIMGEEKSELAIVAIALFGAGTESVIVPSKSFVEGAINGLSPVSNSPLDNVSCYYESPLQDVTSSEHSYEAFPSDVVFPSGSSTASSAASSAVSSVVSSAVASEPLRPSMMTSKPNVVFSAENSTVISAVSSAASPTVSSAASFAVSSSVASAVASEPLRPLLMTSKPIVAFSAETSDVPSAVASAVSSAVSYAVSSAVPSAVFDELISDHRISVFVGTLENSATPTSEASVLALEAEVLSKTATDGDFSCVIDCALPLDTVTDPRGGPGGLANFYTSSVGLGIVSSGANLIVDHDHHRGRNDLAGFSLRVALPTIEFNASTLEADFSNKVVTDGGFSCDMNLASPLGPKADPSWCSGGLSDSDCALVFDYNVSATCENHVAQNIDLEMEKSLATNNSDSFPATTPEELSERMDFLKACNGLAKINALIIKDCVHDVTKGPSPFALAFLESIAEQAATVRSSKGSSLTKKTDGEEIIDLTGSGAIEREQETVSVMAPHALVEASMRASVCETFPDWKYAIAPVLVVLEASETVNGAVSFALNCPEGTPESLLHASIATVLTTESSHGSQMRNRNSSSSLETYCASLKDSEWSKAQQSAASLVSSTKKTGEEKDKKGEELVDVIGDVIKGVVVLRETVSLTDSCVDVLHRGSSLRLPLWEQASLDSNNYEAQGTASLDLAVTPVCATATPSMQTPFIPSKSSSQIGPFGSIFQIDSEFVSTPTRAMPTVVCPTGPSILVLVSTLGGGTHGAHDLDSVIAKLYSLSCVPVSRRSAVQQPTINVRYSIKNRAEGKLLIDLFGASTSLAESVVCEASPLIEPLLSNATGDVETVSLFVGSSRAIALQALYESYSRGSCVVVPASGRSSVQQVTTDAFYSSKNRAEGESELLLSIDRFGARTVQAKSVPRETGSHVELLLSNATENVSCDSLSWVGVSERAIAPQVEALYEPNLSYVASALTTTLHVCTHVLPAESLPVTSIVALPQLPSSIRYRSLIGTSYVSPTPSSVVVSASMQSLPTLALNLAANTSKVALVESTNGVEFNSVNVIVSTDAPKVLAVSTTLDVVNTPTTEISHESNSDDDLQSSSRSISVVAIELKDVKEATPLLSARGHVLNFWGEGNEMHLEEKWNVTSVHPKTQPFRDASMESETGATQFSSVIPTKPLHAPLLQVLARLPQICDSLETRLKVGAFITTGAIENGVLSLLDSTLPSHSFMEECSSGSTSSVFLCRKTVMFINATGGSGVLVRAVFANNAPDKNQLACKYQPDSKRRTKLNVVSVGDTPPNYTTLEEVFVAQHASIQEFEATGQVEISDPSLQRTWLINTPPKVTATSSEIVVVPHCAFSGVAFNSASAEKLSAEPTKPFGFTLGIEQHAEPTCGSSNSLHRTSSCASMFEPAEEGVRVESPLSDYSWTDKLQAELTCDSKFFQQSTSWTLTSETGSTSAVNIVSMGFVIASEIVGASYILASFMVRSSITEQLKVFSLGQSLFVQA